MKTKLLLCFGAEISKNCNHLYYIPGNALYAETSQSRLRRNCGRSLLFLTIWPVLDRLPLEPKGAKECESCAGNRDVVCVAQAGHISLEDSIQGIQAAHTLQDALDLRSTVVDEDVGIDTRVTLVELVNESVLEKGLSDSNEDGAAKRLEELNASSADGDPFLRKNSLHDQNTNLES